MRKALALTCLALTLAACSRKPSEPAAVNTPTPAPAANAPATQPEPASTLPAISPEACAVIATYVKSELKGDFGLPLMAEVKPAKGRVSPGELKQAFPALKPAEENGLAETLTRSIADGEHVACDWKAMGLAQPRLLEPEGQGWIRFRPAVAGDVAILDSVTEAGGVRASGRCLYRRDGETWTRSSCVLTGLG